MTAAAPLLSVTNLCKSFGGVAAVRDVSFDLRPGQLVALIGSNGAGKTTTFNCINGQIAPDSGSIAYHPRALPTSERIRQENDNTTKKNFSDALIDITKTRPRVTAKLGISRTFQITATFASMTVLENVQMVLIAHRKLWWRVFGRASHCFRKQALELLELVGLQNHSALHAATLAYGDLKRLDLAMALANEPRLLLMDEPTAGMGVQERDTLMSLVRKIAKQKDIGVLFTEHDMDAVFHYADWIIVAHRGTIIARGTAATIKEDPQVRDIYLGKDFVHG